MTMATLSCPIAWPMMVTANNSSPALGNHQTLDAAGEYVAYIYEAREAMTISHVGWRTGTVAGSPTADTRIETVGTDGLPTGTLWATDTNIVSGTLSSTTWTLHALTASASISIGQLFAVKILYASGTSIIVQNHTLRRHSTSLPYSVTNVSGAAVKTVLSFGVNLALGSSTSAFYFVENTMPVNVSAVTGAFNNTNSAAKGAKFRVPVKCRCVGLLIYLGTAVGDFNVMIQDDSDNELSSSSTAFDGNYQSEATGGVAQLLFDSPVTLSPATDYRAIIVPSSTTNTVMHNTTLTSADYRSAWPGGTNFYYTARSSGIWSDSTNIVPIMDLVLDQFDDGNGSNAAGHGNMTGGMQ